MRELHVIVKEEAVRTFASGKGEMREHARQVMAEIERIKRNKDYLMIDDFSYQLHPRMPSPSDNLIVWVSGGLKNIACTLQLYNLRLRGYLAMFHPTACLDLAPGLTEPYKLPLFRELVPEYPAYSTN
jgi:hypothetical protein